MLPEGVHVEPYLNRSELVNRNISTVIRNLIEGAIIVFLVLILFLGDVRAGLIVASVIPLAMLFAFILMRVFGVSANLMSLGAVDFGIVVDGSIVILEGILAYFAGRTLTKEEMDAEVEAGAGKVVRSATFAVLIILIVFFPILTLTGIEGKYFTPMAKTLVFCIIGTLVLSLTYVPMMASLFLRRTVSLKNTFADRFFERLGRGYQRVLDFSLKHLWGVLGALFAALIASLVLFTKLGAEFIPTLDEGDFLIPVKGNRLFPVSVDTILYFYIADGTVKAVDKELKEMVFPQTLDELTEVLNPQTFFRANWQFLISKQAMQDVVLWFNGRLAVNLEVSSAEKVIISKARVADFKEWFCM